MGRPRKIQPAPDSAEPNPSDIQPAPDSAEPEDDGLVPMWLGPELIRVHPSNVQDHIRLGWKGLE